MKQEGFAINRAMRLIMSVLSSLLWVCVSGCATIIQGTTDVVLIESPDPLVFYDSTGKLMPMRIDTGAILLEHSIELSKKRESHRVVASSGADTMQLQFIREPAYGMLIAGGVVTYGIGTIVDLTTKAGYQFPDMRVFFREKDRIVASQKEVEVQQARDSLPRPYLLQAYVGFLEPGGQPPLSFTHWGLEIGHRLAGKFWLAAGFEGAVSVAIPIDSPDSHQGRLTGYLVDVRWQPIRFVSLGLGLAWQQFAVKPGNTYTVDRSSATGDVLAAHGSVSFIFGGFLAELRRYVSLKPLSLSNGRSVKLDLTGIHLGVSLQLFGPGQPP